MSAQPIILAQSTPPVPGGRPPQRPPLPQQSAPPAQQAAPPTQPSTSQSAQQQSVPTQPQATTAVPASGFGFPTFGRSSTELFMGAGAVAAAFVVGMILRALITQWKARERVDPVTAAWLGTMVCITFVVLTALVIAGFLWRIWLDVYFLGLASPLALLCLFLLVLAAVRARPRL